MKGRFPFSLRFAPHHFAEETAPRPAPVWEKLAPGGLALSLRLITWGALCRRADPAQRRNSNGLLAVYMALFNLMISACI
jgi:hypothetical protein